MPTLCDPLSHHMDIDDYDLGEHSGYCDICGAQLTYKWEYDQDQVDNSTHHLFKNMDMATMGDYQNPLQSFAVLSRVDEDPKLEYGVLIIPYILNSLFNKLKRFFSKSFKLSRSENFLTEKLNFAFSENDSEKTKRTNHQVR